MLDILSIGDIKLDTFIVIPEASVQCQLKQKPCQLCIEYGKKIPVDEIDMQIAGSAPNVAVGLAKMKRKSSVLSFMGQDATYRSAIEFLKAHKVDTKHIQAIKKARSSFAAVLNYQGESTQLAAHSDIPYKLPKQFPKTKWVHISELGDGYKAVYRYLSKCIKGLQVSINPGVVQIEEGSKELFDLLKCTNTLFLNLREAQQLLNTKIKDPKKLLKMICALGPHIAVITDGQNGSYATDGKQTYHAPMFPGARKEATGAGDAFATGFLGALMQKKDISSALAWGSVNAASVVQSIGPTQGLLSHLQIQKQLRDNKKYKVKNL